MTILDAKARLEGEGLHVSCNNAHSLCIAASVRDAGDEIRLSEDACALICEVGRCVAIFPAAGPFTYEVPGKLPDLVAVITAVYAQHRRGACPFIGAFTQAVREPDQYLVGRSPARV